MPTNRNFVLLFLICVLSCLPHTAEAQTPNKKTIKVARNPQEVLLSKEALQNARTYYYTDLEEALKEPDKVYKFSLHYVRKGEKVDSKKNPFNLVKEPFAKPNIIKNPIDRGKIKTFFEKHASLFRNLQSLEITFPYNDEDYLYFDKTQPCNKVDIDINKYLKELKYLQELWLNRVHEPCTKLKEVLGTLAGLEYFKFLTLSEAYIPKMPQEVLSLKNLQALYFYNIKFEEKPWIVFDVPTLEYLHFINADLKDIDEGITKLKNLKELGIEEGRRYSKNYEELLPDVNIVYIELE